MKKDELERTEGIFPQNLMNDFVRDKLKKLLICKILLKQMTYIISQSVEIVIILMNILFLLFFKI